MMMKLKQCLWKWLWWFYQPQIQRRLRWITAGLLAGVSLHAFADSGQDLLQGTDTTAYATFQGTGKKLVYLVEGIFAIALFIKTKNLLIFTGIVAIALFINALLKLAGVS